MPEFLQVGCFPKQGMTRKAKILIVEDDTSVAMLMEYLLDRDGCEVRTSVNAEKAIMLAQDGNFDLITLDINLPGISGFEMCCRLKNNSQLCETPVVFISGRPYKEDQQRSFELGAVDYIPKPFDALNFANRILSHVKPKNFNPILKGA